MASEVVASQEPGNTKLALDVQCVKGKTLKARRFQLTLNQIDKWDELKLWLEHYKSLNYGIACQEVAPTTGHIHIHCFIQFSNTIAMNLSKLCGAHIEPCRGSTKSNIDYIQKDGDIIWEVGEAPHQGTQYTVADLKKANIDELPWQMYNTATRVQQATANKIHKENRYIKTPDVQWHFGGTGSGKSYYAKNNDYRSITYDGSKYEDWEDDRKIQFEEFRGNVPWSDLLKITDKYHNTDKLRILYGHKYIDFDAIYIASSKPPWEVYPNREKNDDIKQLMRRLKWIVYEHRQYDGEFEYRLWRYNLEDDEPCIIQEWEPWVVECTIPNYDI